jgi:hypothetical protein
MIPTTTHGVQYAWIAATVMGLVAGVAWLVEDQWLVFSAAILGLYVLHLVSVRYIVQAQAEQLAAVTGEAETTGSIEVEAEAGLEAEAEDERPGTASVSRATGNGVGGAPVPASVTASSDAGDTSGASTTGGDSGDTGPDSASSSESVVREVAIPRHFMLGTVAIVRHVMEPEAVARVLMEQRQQPGKRFGELAVEMGFITGPQLDELLEAQQDGLFTDAEIREARQRLEAFRRTHAPAGTV